MKYRLIIVSLALTVLSWNWGCTRRPVPVERPQINTAEELVSRLAARSGYWKTYQARLQIRGESSRGKFRFQSIILSQLPDSFRLEAYTGWGQTAGVLVISGEGSRLWIPSEKVIYTAQRPQDLVDYLLGVPIPLEVFGYALIASVPPDQLRGWQVRRDAGGWLGVAQDVGNNLSLTWQFLPNPASLQGIRVDEYFSHYKIAYEPAVSLDLTSTPERIHFASSEWQMEVRVSQMQVPRDLQASVFRLPFPEGIRTVSLDRAR
jgi:outer membrane biogenesis lipoprotein LolB